jgi:hypothetical protein
MPKLHVGQSCPQEYTRRILCERVTKNASAKEQENFHPFGTRCRAVVLHVQCQQVVNNN